MTAQSTGIQRVTGISNLTREDILTFRSIRRSFTCYADSWLYLVRATRCDNGDFGYKYFDGRLFAGIGFRKNVVYLVHPIGEIRTSVLADLCHELHRTSGLTVVLRKIPDDLHAALVKTGRFQEGTCLLSPAILEDDAFPEHTVDLTLLFRMDSSSRPTLAKLARQVRKFDSRSWELQKVGRRIENTIQAEMILKELSAAHVDKYSAYRMLVQEAFLNLEAYPTLLSRIYKDNYRVHGLYIGEDLSSGTAGLYCALSSAAHRGITEWMDIDFFRHLYQLGFREILFGGSETSGVHRYVEKFRPARSTPRMHCLIYKGSV